MAMGCLQARSPGTCRWSHRLNGRKQNHTTSHIDTTWYFFTQKKIPKLPVAAASKGRCWKELQKAWSVGFLYLIFLITLFGSQIFEQDISEIFLHNSKRQLCVKLNTLFLWTTLHSTDLLLAMLDSLFLWSAFFGPINHYLGFSAWFWQTLCSLFQVATLPVTSSWEVRSLTLHILKATSLGRTVTSTFLGTDLYQ